MTTSSPTTSVGTSTAVLVTPRNGGSILGALLLILAGVVILMGIITAEALYPATYTTHDNEISDLGATRPPDSVVLQPSANIFNATMLASGQLLLAAAALQIRSTRRRAYIALMVTGIAVTGVGIFPGNREPWHPLFALLTFTSGGTAAILVGLTFDGLMRYVSVVLGAITLGVLAFAIVGAETVIFREMGDGGIERWVAYPTTLWFVVAGGYLLGRQPHG